jgi:signal transduction histidine kinase/DNA-binding response OmpR family regulator
MKQFSVIDKWFTRLVFHKNDTPEIIIRKKFFLITNLIAIFFISCLAVLSHILDLKNFANYLLILLACNIAQTILLLIIRKWSRHFIYSVFSLYVVLIFYIIIRLGGIANSAGLLMAAYFFLLTSQWMEDAKLLILIGVLYIIGVLITGISYPYLKVDESLSGWKNNLFFAINYAWIGLLLAVALYYSIVKSENAAKSRAEQLQELDLLKSKLYANVAHEFRTPLTLIRGNAEEIGEHYDGETFDRANSIVQNSDKILFLVNQMLNLSRVEEGGVPVHYVQGDLVAFVRFIVGSFQGYADLRKIGLHFQPLCPQLMMDIEAEKLEESISNLLSNAIKYTPEGGNVYITVLTPVGKDKQTKSEQQVDDQKLTSTHQHLGISAPHQQQVEISVRDTGIGIPEDQLDKIFIRFYRVEDKRFPYREGTGIGLTLVSEYLKLMKGSISVSSTPGTGSEFVIVLPVTQNAEIADVIPIKGTYTHKEEISALKSGPAGCVSDYPCLLIIEDNKELIEYLIGLLGGEYQILTAENGIRGIEQAIEHIPDIILSDIMMPGKDGYQVCKELKNDFRTNHIPIVLLTARADTGSRITGLEHGADAYLTKPFDRKELMVCLHNLFVQREKLRQKYQSNLYEQLPEEPAGGLSDQFLNRTIKILEQNYRKETFRIEDLYQRLGISRVQLHRKLTALTGQSASEFIRNFRLQKARRLLLETDNNVSEIAYMVGFTDPNYFTRTFTEEHGMTPTDLRKSFI